METILLGSMVVAVAVLIVAVWHLWPEVGP